jgi:retinol dehydrogenase-12
MDDARTASAPAPASLAARIRSRLIAAPRATPADLRGRRIIVTGASAGSIGFHTASTLAAWGAEVTVTARSRPEALAAMLGRSGEVDAIALDLADAASVESFAATYVRRHGERLDVLINNAGVHLDLLSQWKQPHLSADGFEIQWRTNYLGTMHLTQRLLPLLLNAGAASGDARIVNLVSQLHLRGRNDQLFERTRPYNSWDAYGLSKLALVHATFEIQRRYEQHYLQAFCLHPGAVLTDIASKGLAGNPAIEAVRKALRPIEAFLLLTPEEGAQTSLHCAAQPQLQGGRYFRACAPAQPSAEAADAATAARLWQRTQSWIDGLGR